MVDPYAAVNRARLITSPINDKEKSMPTLPLNDRNLLREQAFINAQWCDADDAATLTVNNPASGEALASIPAWVPTRPAGQSRPPKRRGPPGVRKQRQRAQHCWSAGMR
ncbi:hypothetical protein HORIV_64110 [Vreelandella olivaria]|uniref:Uncharacterized protein n=1 Tax=Vreelandella olivaria TaxID=390919 RepID=A0ABM7GTJ1_9GAMM|nr:hypothetical protein HORIV_64110 [Halomonas olivaria]